MTYKHTPGPWFVSPATRTSDGGVDFGIGAVIDGRPHCIAEAFEVVDRGVSVNARANGHLISAAPDLYEACKIAGTAEIFGVDGIIDFDVLEIVISAAKTATAKAEGESND